MAADNATPERRLRILAVSQDFSPANPSGAALLRILNGMADRNSITCLGGGPRPDRMKESIRYCRAPCLRGCGLLAAFLSFHVSHLVAWFWLRAAKGERFDVVQTIDAESLLGTVVTFHCCSAAILEVASSQGLLRGDGPLEALACFQARALYALRAWFERRVSRARRTRGIIALSAGSAEDIKRCYSPRVEPAVIPNALS
jgi:hypothetical protein